MIEHIPQQVDSAFLYFHSAGMSSAEFAPFLAPLAERLPRTYIWAGDGAVSKSPLMRQGALYGEDALHYWFTFPMQDASSPESFAEHAEAMGAALSCAGAYINVLVDQILSRFHLPAKRAVLSGFQHGSCAALAASMIRLRDPFAYTILFESYLLESYYLKDELSLPDTTVVCIDNQHIRSRTLNWLNIDTVQQFESYGIATRHITVAEGENDLNWAMMREAADIMRGLPG